MEGYFMFQWEGIVFQMGGRGGSFLSWGGRAGNPWRGISFDGGELQEIVGWGAPPLPNMSNLETLCLLEKMEGVNDNASAFMHLHIKINK